MKEREGAENEPKKRPSRPKRTAKKRERGGATPNPLPPPHLLLSCFAVVELDPHMPEEGLFREGFPVLLREQIIWGELSTVSIISVAPLLVARMSPLKILEAAA